MLNAPVRQPLSSSPSWFFGVFQATKPYIKRDWSVCQLLILTLTSQPQNSGVRLSSVFSFLHLHALQGFPPNLDPCTYLSQDCAVKNVLFQSNNQLIVWRGACLFGWPSVSTTFEPHRCRELPARRSPALAINPSSVGRIVCRRARSNSRQSRS